MRGEGLPSDGGTRGDLFIYIAVDMPKKLTPDQKRKLEEILGHPKKDPDAGLGNTVIARVLKETKEKFEEQKAEQWAREEMSNRNGERSGHRAGRRQQGQQGAECVQQ